VPAVQPIFSSIQEPKEPAILEKCTISDTERFAGFGGGANASRLNRLLAVEAQPKADGIPSSEGEAREEEGSEPSCGTVGAGVGG